MANVARLVNQIVPGKYTLDIDLDMETFRYALTEKFTFELTSPTRELVLHGKGLDISKTRLDGDIQAIATPKNSADELVTFEFEAEIAAGSHYLELEISGVVSDSLHGFYRSSYDHNGTQKWLATTQFEAVHAREVFACVDEPLAKAVFELSIVAPDNLVAISNTNVVSEEPARPGRKRVRFAATPRMSTYLLCFVIGELEYMESVTPEGVLVRAYATPGKASQLSFAVDTAVKTLSFYSDYFGIAYPLPKLDMIAIPDFASGAMENWGAVTYRETDLLLDPAKTSLANRQRVVVVVAHELAHQWFGNLVTMAWWNDLWLNEGFATWVEVLAMDKLYPEWQAWDDFTTNTMAYSMDLDGLANTHAIQVDVEDPRSLDEIFDAISYFKGASIINMIAQYIGATAFRKGLHKYLDAHKYANSVTGDLWAALAEAADKPVVEMMSAWTSQPGYPIVSFEDGTAKQARFYSSPREAKTAAAAKADWPIPFSVIRAGGETSDPILMEREVELSDEVVGADWFKPNPGQTAFFRTLYTDPMVKALGAPLRDKSLAARDRFGVVDDVFEATRAGLADTSVALNLLVHMRDESDFVVWSAVGGGLSSVLGVTEDKELRKRLESFGHWLVQPNVSRLGWDQKPHESAFDTLMRPVVMQQAVRFDDKAVTAEAKRRFEAFLEGADLDPDLRPVVLYGVARHGGEREFEAILSRYRVEQSPQMKMGLLTSLGRFRSPELIDRFLALGISEDVRPQDIFRILAWGFLNRHARDATWAFVKDHWELFLERYGEGGHMLEHFPLYAGSGFATHAMAAEIKAFFGARPHPSTNRPAAQAVETIELKADWFERDRDKIAAFLGDWKHKK